MSNTSLERGRVLAKTWESIDRLEITQLTFPDGTSQTTAGGGGGGGGSDVPTDYSNHVGHVLTVTDANGADWAAPSAGVPTDYSNHVGHVLTVTDANGADWAAPSADTSTFFSGRFGTEHVLDDTLEVYQIQLEDVLSTGHWSGGVYTVPNSATYKIEAGVWVTVQEKFTTNTNVSMGDVSLEKFDLVLEKNTGSGNNWSTLNNTHTTRRNLNNQPNPSLATPSSFIAGALQPVGFVGYEGVVSFIGSLTQGHQLRLRLDYKGVGSIGGAVGEATSALTKINPKLEMSKPVNLVKSLGLTFFERSAGLSNATHSYDHLADDDLASVFHFSRRNRTDGNYDSWIMINLGQTYGFDKLNHVAFSAKYGANFLHDLRDFKVRLGNSTIREPTPANGNNVPYQAGTHYYESSSRSANTGTIVIKGTSYDESTLDTHHFYPGHADCYAQQVETALDGQTFQYIALHRHSTSIWSNYYLHCWLQEVDVKINGVTTTPTVSYMRGWSVSGGRTGATGAAGQDGIVVNDPLNSMVANKSVIVRNATNDGWTHTPKGYGASELGTIVGGVAQTGSETVNLAATSKIGGVDIIALNGADVASNADKTIVTDGSGTLSWATPGGGGTPVFFRLENQNTTNVSASNFCHLTSTHLTLADSSGVTHSNAYIQIQTAGTYSLTLSVTVTDANSYSQYFHTFIHKVNSSTDPTTVTFATLSGGANLARSAVDTRYGNDSNDDFGRFTSCINWVGELAVGDRVATAMRTIQSSFLPGEPRTTMFQGFKLG